MSKWLAAFREASASDQADILSAPKNLTETAIDGRTHTYTPPISKENLSMLKSDRFLGADSSAESASRAAVDTTVAGLYWDAETAILIRWFLTTTPPPEPFELCRGVSILRPAQFWADLKADIARGPNRARGLTGALQDDLRKLYELFGSRTSKAENAADGE